VSERRLDPEQLGDHVDRLYRAAWALTGDRHEAEDLVQDTFAKVLARPRIVSGTDDLGYLLRALSNQHTSRFRRRRSRPPEVPLDHAITDDHGPDDAYAAREVFAAIARLEPDGRAAIVAVDVVGLSYAEAGDLLGVKEATVATRLHRARHAIAAALGADPAVRQ
jgi:RNA polymerase sigma-70 factor, ECF subfamily